MRPTRQSWAVGGLAVVVTVLAIGFDHPLLLGATALLGGWLLARQYVFFRTVNETLDALSVNQSVPASAIRTDETLPVTLTAERSDALGLSLTLDAGVPSAARLQEPLSLSLEPTQSAAEQTAVTEWPVAGRHTFDELALTATDGLFEITVPLGQTPTVTVEPRGPRNIHLGEGGDRVAIAEGAHAAGRLRSGLEPAELREYVPGDTADQIDWNATARLAAPHVREYESETDQPTVLVVDQRPSLAIGPPDETKLDYLREVALAITESTAQLDDPLGFVSVDENAITARIAPSTTRHRAIRRHLLDLDTKPKPDAPAEATPSAGLTLATLPRSALGELSTDSGDALSRSLTPFYRSRQLTHEQVDSEPLLAAVRVATSRQRGRVLTIIFTDESNPATVREAVSTARADGNDVLVILAPTVLFEPGGLRDAERAYDRYRSVETFRSELDDLERVRALEVAPGDRIETLLALGDRYERTQRSRQRGGLQ